MTPHMQKFGAKEISRGEFLAKLKETQAEGLDLF
jgi:Leu/Phe-tRNA-protein transferase